jgi:hypothetical protein
MLRQKFNAEKIILVMLYNPSEVFRHFFLSNFWSPLVTMITSVLVKNTTRLGTIGNPALETIYSRMQDFQFVSLEL